MRVGHVRCRFAHLGFGLFGGRVSPKATGPTTTSVAGAFVALFGRGERRWQRGTWRYVARLGAHGVVWNIVVVSVGRGVYRGIWSGQSHVWFNSQRAFRDDSGCWGRRSTRIVHRIVVLLDRPHGDGSVSGFYPHPARASFCIAIPRRPSYSRRGSHHASPARHPD